VNPLILAIDTTREAGSLALARGEELIDETLVHAPGGFAHVIYGQLAQLLGRHGVKPAMVDCFAAASGPGSFTGVRVGLACVKGLAEALGKPAVAVSNLEAMATFGSARLRAVVMDARRGEIYGAVYDDAGRLASPEVVMTLAAWLETLPEGKMEFIAMDPAALAGTRFEHARIATAPPALAGAMARIALARFLGGEASDPAALDANYVRRSDAELLWRE
jgi:tRNA threonylcarbamoyladenosine biosynthesis protein TsaB